MHYLNMALIDKASLLMVPSTYEAGTLYNVLPSGNRAPDSTDQNSGYDQTRADFTFDRGSNAAATRIDENGVLQKYRENLLTESNNFSDSDWTRVNASVTSGQADKDGGTDAWLVSASGSGAKYVLQSEAATGVHTFSLYAKKGTSKGIRISLFGGGDRWANFNLETGALVATGNSPIDTKIESIGESGWFRISVVSNKTASGWVAIYPLDNSFNANYTADGETIYIQSAQLETGLVATDYLDSGATTAKAGVLIDLPRINYDANGENGSLLLEPSRQQLVQYSEYFGDSSWDTFSGATLGSSFVESPEGLNNAYTLNFASGIESLIYYNYSSGSATFTTSVWARSDSGKKFCFRHWDGTNAQRSADFTTTTEWQRFDYTLTSPIINFGICNQSAGGVGSIEIYGFQAELGSYATSYIPNHGTSGGVTRAADSCSVTGVSDVIGQTEGTIFVDLTFDGITSENRQILQISDGSTNNLHFRIRNSNHLQAYGSGNFSPFDERLALTEDGRYKMALGYSNGDFAYYVNGVQIATDTQSTAASNLSEIYLGINNLSSTPLGGQVTEAVLFKERLSNAELAALTA